MKLFKVKQKYGDVDWSNPFTAEGQVLSLPLKFVFAAILFCSVSAAFGVGYLLLAGYPKHRCIEALHYSYLGMAVTLAMAAAYVHLFIRGDGAGEEQAILEDPDGANLISGSLSIPSVLGRLDGVEAYNDKVFRTEMGRDYIIAFGVAAVSYPAICSSMISGFSIYGGVACLLGLLTALSGHLAYRAELSPITMHNDKALRDILSVFASDMAHDAPIEITFDGSGCDQESKKIDEQKRKDTQKVTYSDQWLSLSFKTADGSALKVALTEVCRITSEQIGSWSFEKKASSAESVGAFRLR